MYFGYNRHRTLTLAKLTHAHEWASSIHSHVFSLPEDQFRGKPWLLIAAIDSFSQSNGFPSVTQAPDIDTIRRLLGGLNPKPKMGLEFGTFIGGSALALGATLQDLNGADADAGGARVYSFEVDPDLAGMARDLVELAGLEDVVFVLDEYGSEGLKQLCDEDMIKPHQVDMVFFDHWEECFLPDLRLCEELNVLHKGSMVVANNAGFPRALPYVDYVRKGGRGIAGAVRYKSDPVESTSRSNPTVTTPSFSMTARLSKSVVYTAT